MLSCSKMDRIEGTDVVRKEDTSRPENTVVDTDKIHAREGVAPSENGCVAGWEECTEYFGPR